MSSSWFRIAIVYMESRAELTSCSPSGSVLQWEGSPFPHSDLWLLVGEMLGNLCVCVREGERGIVTPREGSPQIPQHAGLVRSHQSCWVQALGTPAPGKFHTVRLLGVRPAGRRSAPGPPLSLGAEFLFPKS